MFVKGGVIMLIGGLQKLSLLDYPDRTCCTVFTVGCNYRCPFCHNGSIIQDTHVEQVIPEKEIIKFLKKRINLLDGVCITGGEPLLQEGLEDFIYEIKSLGFSIKLDTNGSHPQRLAKLIDNKLVDYVAMDIKNAPDKYSQTVGIKNFDLTPIIESISILMTDTVPYEFRTTVVRELHSYNDMLSIARWIEGTKNYYIQNFVNSTEVLNPGLSSYSKKELQAFLEFVLPYIPGAELRGV